MKLFSKKLLSGRATGRARAKGYQRGNLGKSHQNSDYLKQAMQKSYTKAADSKVIQRLYVRILLEHNFFALLVLNSRRSDGSSLDFHARKFLFFLQK